jgi:hypothetical protein
MTEPSARTSTPADDLLTALAGERLALIGWTSLGGEVAELVFRNSRNGEVVYLRPFGLSLRAEVVRPEPVQRPLIDPPGLDVSGNFMGHG